MKNNKLTGKQVNTLQLKLLSALSFYNQRPEIEARNMADLLTLAAAATSELQEYRKAAEENERREHGTSKYTSDFYMCQCPECGWFGSSEDVYGDHEICDCPNCHTEVDSLGEGELWNIILPKLTELQEYRNASTQPVAYIFKHPAGKLFWALTDESNKGQNDVMPVYAAPPAPVSEPGELTREEYKRRFMEEDEFDDTFLGGWNACRAAMRGKAKPGNLPVIPDGWQLVPKEATKEMLDAAWISHAIHHPSAYRTMIAAAPLPPDTIEMLASVLANAPLAPIDSQGKKRS